MATMFRDRVFCSLMATGIAWVVSGIVFTLVVKGPSTVSAWLIWGTGLFVGGWILVGLPIVALGDKVFRMNPLLLAMVAGVGGVIVIELPYIIVRILTPTIHFVWTAHDFIWPGFAFVIAAPAALLYRTLLGSKHVASENG